MVKDKMPRIHVVELSDTVWQIRVGDKTVGVCTAEGGWNCAEGHWVYLKKDGKGLKGNVGGVIEQIINGINAARQDDLTWIIHRGCRSGRDTRASAR